MTNLLNSSRNEQDTAWKEVLDHFFKDCIHLCLPHLAQLINWELPPIALDKELLAITKGAETGMRLLDKLFKVFLKDGSEQWVLIHIEVQGRPEDHFPKRMFTYAYRIWDKYQKLLLSCAILTDDDKTWRPNSYETGFAGSRLSAEFLIIKLIDYREQLAELEKSNNPFASVIYVQLVALEMKSKSNQQRKDIKFMLTKRLYDKGFTKQKIDNLYKFIDWLIGLPKELEINYLDDVYELERANNVAYITSAERLGIEKGIIETAKRLLAEGVNPAFVAKVTELPLGTIKALQDQMEQKIIHLSESED